jgi:hypothetical protein
VSKNNERNAEKGKLERDAFKKLAEGNVKEKDQEK